MTDSELNRRELLQTTSSGLVGVGAVSTATATTTHWGESCTEAPLIDATGEYSGTLDSPNDSQYFKLELAHGEYLAVDVFTPLEADDPRIYIPSPETHEFTLRNGSNVELHNDQITLEPGIEGSFELWAETDTILCFSITDVFDGGTFPYEWTITTDKRISAPPDDSWGDSCTDAPIIDATGAYDGTLVSPSDTTYFKLELDHGEYLAVETFVPVEADDPRIYIPSPETHEFTLRNGSNVELHNDQITLEPGIEGSFELWAESDSIFCLNVIDVFDRGSFPYTWEFTLDKQLSAPPDDSWGDSCTDAPVIDATGAYDGTLVSPSDTTYFKLELDHGEYLTVETFVPVEADDPRIYIPSPETYEFTLRNGSNVELHNDQITLEPGIEGSFEVWAETDTILCFSIADVFDHGSFPYEWEVTMDKRISAPPDGFWGDSCSDAPVIDTTGAYEGTLISPSDADYFRLQLDAGEVLDLAAFVPAGADQPRIYIQAPDTHEFTLRNGSNVELGNDQISLEPGTEGSVEIVAEADSVFCFSVVDVFAGGAFAYDWQLTLSDPSDPAFFALSGLETNGPVVAGDTLAITVDIHNTGAFSTNQTVELNVPGLGSDSTVVALNPDESMAKTFTLETTAEAAGTYTATVASEDDELSEPIEIEPAEASTICQFTNTDGIVESDGLREAVDQWRRGDIETGLLRETIDAWRSSDPISRC